MFVLNLSLTLISTGDQKLLSSIQNYTTNFHVSWGENIPALNDENAGTIFYKYAII